MQEIRKAIDRTVFGLVLYTLLRYAVFAAEPLARKCWVWLTIPDSSRRQEVLTQLNSSASGSGVSSIAAVCVGVLFLGWYFRKSTPPGKLFSRRQPLPLKGFLLLSCIFMGAQLIYSLFGNSLELLLRLFGYTAMGQLDAASAQSTTLSMFLYTAVFAPVGEELIYRGLVMPQFQRYGKVFAIVTSALLFGVMHANLFQMPFAFLTGLVLGYTAAEFSLRWSILLHLLNNLVFSDGVSFPCRTGLSLPWHQHFLFRFRRILAAPPPGTAETLPPEKRMRRKNLCRRFYGSGNAGVSHRECGAGGFRGSEVGIKKYRTIQNSLHGAILFIAVQEKRCSCTHYFSMPSFKVWSDQLSSVVFTGYAPQYVPSTLRITVHFCCPDDAVYTSKSTVW